VPAEPFARAVSDAQGGQTMNVERTSLDGVLLLRPAIYRDARGSFMESYNERQMAEAGLPTRWVQDNASISRRNVLRGIHYQIAQPQGKLVRVTHGAVLDVAVDLRRSSPAFGQNLFMELRRANDCVERSGVSDSLADCRG